MRPVNKGKSVRCTNMSAMKLLTFLTSKSRVVARKCDEIDFDNIIWNIW